MITENETINNPTKEPTYPAMNLVYNSSYPNVAYEVNTGSFYRIKPDGSLIRELQVNETGMLNVLLESTGKSTNRKAALLAHEFLTNETVPEDYVVYHKDMNTDNLKASNLGVIHKDDNRNLKDALANLDGVLKLFPDGKEIYCYKVRYRNEGKTKWIRFNDVVSAKRFKRNLMIFSTKLIARYTITE